MTTRPYAVFGALVIAALLWAHFTGWAIGDPSETKTVPRSLRDNPGSYRAIYGPRAYTGAK